MFKLIRVGLAGAGVQSIVVVGVAILFAAMMHTSVVKDASDFDSSTLGMIEMIDSYLPLVRYTYLLLAAGIILTHSRWSDIATADARRTSLVINPFSPRRITESIFGQLMIVTICFGIAVLRPPPYILEVSLYFLESRWIISVIWSGAMSVAMVAFGISAAAAKKAMQEPHAPSR